jgi:hypothetical protein
MQTSIWNSKVFLMPNRLFASKISQRKQKLQRMAFWLTADKAAREGDSTCYSMQQFFCPVKAICFVLLLQDHMEFTSSTYIYLQWGHPHEDMFTGVREEVPLIGQYHPIVQAPSCMKLRIGEAY